MTTPAPDYLAHLRTDAVTVTELLVTTPLDASVAACPGWGLRDLVLHLGYVHRWARDCVRTGEPSRAGSAPVPDSELADWFSQGAEDLIAALATTDPGRPCWTLAGPGTVAFWHRRQALETVVHRVDAERAAGSVDDATSDCPASTRGGLGAAVDLAEDRGIEVAEDLAEDGIAEVVDVLFPRQIARGRSNLPNAGVTLVAATSGRSWHIGAEPATATLHGSASDLFLLLWRRRHRTDRAFSASGDLEALDSVLAHDLTP